MSELKMVRADDWGARYNSNSGIRVSAHLLAPDRRILTERNPYNENDEREIVIKNGACLLAISGWPLAKGNIFCINHSDGNTLGYIYEIIKDEFDGRESAFWLWWWDFLTRCGLLCAGNIDNAAIGEHILEENHNYATFIGQAVLMDTPRRYAAAVYTMRQLDKRLKINPWFVLQIAHFIPWNRSGNLPLTKERIGYASNLKRDQINHCCGNMNGEFALVPSLEDSVKNMRKLHLLSGSFFPKGNPDACPNPSWTWDDFAQYAEEYVSKYLRQTKAA